jgi:hypothetical protein
MNKTERTFLVVTPSTHSITVVCMLTHPYMKSDTLNKSVCNMYM